MKKIITLSLVLLLGLMLIGCNSTQTDKVIAVVNGEEITGQQFDQYYNMLKNSYESQMGELDAKKDKELISSIKDKAYNDLVLQVIIVQEAKQQGLKVSDEEINDELKGFKENMGEKGYKDFLHNLGIDEDELFRQIKIEKLANKLRDKVTAEVTVKDEVVKEYYNENKDSFLEPGGIQISHILVATEKEAEDILKKINEGQDFAELAKKYSTGPSGKNGGDLGIVNEDTNFVPEFKQAALGLNPGEITKEPVKTEFGYHIIKAGEKKEAKTPSFAEVKENIKLQLVQSEKNKVFDKYLQDLKDKAEIIDNKN